MKGSDLVRLLPANNVAERDAMLLGAVESGQIVFDLVPVQLGPRLKVYVMAWPLRFGTAGDCVALGTTADTQQRIADALGMRVITPLIADACWLQADVKVSPQTQPINHRTDGYVKHSDAITACAQRWQLDEGSDCPPRLVAGWKDWCLTRDALAKGKPTNYGWHLPDGFRWAKPAPAVTGGGLTVIQGPHEAHSGAHADYSQLIRLAHARAELDGQPVSLDDVLTGELGHAVALLAAHDGPLGASRFPWVQPSAAGAAPLPDPVQGPANGTQDDPPRITTPGERGDDVEAWQRHLLSQGYSLPRFGADADHGGETEAATLRYLADRGIVRPLPADPSEVEAPFPPLVGDMARRGVFGALDFEPAPTRDNPEGIRILGNWSSQNIVRVKIPQLVGVDYGPKDGQVYFHRLAAEQLRGMWQAWEDAGLLSLVLTWAGAWAPRFIRGSRKTLSNHAYGSAFDINAPWNGLGREPAKVGAKGCVRELVPIAHRFGFYWGGHFKSRRDGMHFEVAKIV